MKTSYWWNMPSDNLRTFGHWLARHWNWFWFGPGFGPLLGFYRFFLGTLCLIASFFSLESRGWWEVAPAYWFPTLTFRLLHIHPLPEAWETPALWVFRLALLLAALGLFSRVSLAVSAVAGFYFFGIGNNFGKISHTECVLMYGLLILPFTPCGDFWSIDSLRPKFRPASGAAYKWGVKLVELMVSSVVFIAGLEKLRYSGLTSWILSDSLGLTIIRHFYTHEPLTNIGAWIVDYPVFYKTSAAITLVAEVGAPLLAFLPATPRVILLLGIWGMFAGFGLLLGVFFKFVVIAYAIFLPWDRIGAWLCHWLAPRVPSHHVLFDGYCGLCGKTVRALRRMDVLEALTFVDIHREWQTVTSSFPWLTEKQPLIDSMHVVTNGRQTTDGYFAYRQIAWSVPALWPLLPLLYLPGASMIGSFVYGWIAHRRNGAVCEMPGAAE